MPKYRCFKCGLGNLVYWQEREIETRMIGGDPYPEEVVYNGFHCDNPFCDSEFEAKFDEELNWFVPEQPVSYEKIPWWQKLWTEIMQEEVG